MLAFGDDWSRDNPENSGQPPRPRDEILGLPQVTNAVSQFLDASASFTPLEAIRLGSVKLLDRIWNSSDQLLTPDTKPTEHTWLRKFLHNDRHYQQYLFAIGLEDAVSRKDLELVKWFLTTFQGLTVSSEVVVKACLAGSMEILQLFYENDTRVLKRKGAAGVGHNVEWGGSTLSAAIQGRRSDIVWWLHRHFLDAKYDLLVALRSAIMMGDVLIAEWLISQGAKWPGHRGVKVVRRIAAEGRHDVLQWLDERGQLEGNVGMVVQASEKGRLDTVKWLVERSSSNERGQDDNLVLNAEALRAIHAAAINGHLEVAKFLREVTQAYSKLPRGDPSKTQNPQVESLVYVKNAVVVGGSTMAKAASNGHLEVVKWLYSEYSGEPSVELFANEDITLRAPRTSFTCTAMDAAALGGHLDVVKYLHELQLSIEARTKTRKRNTSEKVSRPTCTERAMAGAASNGHLNMVQWLHHNRREGCSTDAMDLAASNGHLEVVQWLHEHRQEGCTVFAMDSTARNGHMEVVRWLHANTQVGCTVGAMDDAASNGHLEVVKWLHEHRTEGCTTAAMDGAARRGTLNVVKWLHANRTEGCTTKAMDSAAEADHLRVMKWLHKHRTEGCSRSAVFDAVGSNHFEVFLFLITQLQQECTQAAAHWSVQMCCREINAWIREHQPEVYESLLQDE